MRLREGMDMERYYRKGGAFDEERLGRLVEAGLVDIHGPRLAATRSGRPLLNYILREIVA